MNECSNCFKEKELGVCDIWDNEDFSRTWHCKECCDKIHDPNWKIWHQDTECNDLYPLSNNDYDSVKSLDKDMENNNWCDNCKASYTLGYFGRT